MSANPDLKIDYAILSEPSGIDRITIGMKCETIIREAESILEERRGDPSVNFSVNVQDASEAFEADPSSVLVKSLEKAIREVTGRTVILTRKTGASTWLS